MIQAAALLKDLKSLLPRLEADMRQRLMDIPGEDERLREQYQEAMASKRTGATWEAWRDEQVTQAAAAWVLAGVFVRFMEDNGLIEMPWLSGRDERRNLAMDQHTLYFRAHPDHSDRDYLLHVFSQISLLPAVNALFDPRFNPLWRLAPSGDGAGWIFQFWQAIDPTSGALRHDFTDADWDTRFLGDLYQDLSEEVRKKYALLQTPEFVESFILNRTLAPAVAEFGLAKVRLIDPTCGSGHFLLGAFIRLFATWMKREPLGNPRDLTQKALDGVWGVDLNPYAVAIARFRLLVTALKTSGITRMADAPGFVIHLAAGDSLLHGPRFARGGMIQMTLEAEDDPLHHVLHTEDREALRAILGQQYHAVVGNPPYITPKDAILNQAYRDRFTTCHMKYSLGVPFTERFFDLAIQGQENQPAGFVGMITANSFTKAEFGKKLIETFFKQIDLDTVIDTSRAYIPGHGTPTVILFGRHRRPVLSVVRTVQGIRGEPSTPEDAAQGKVWLDIMKFLDRPGESSAFVSVVDTERQTFATHPWSLGGGGAAELKEQIEKNACKQLIQFNVNIGFLVITGEDNCLLLPPNVPSRFGVSLIMPIGDGEAVRDWSCQEDAVTLWPYDYLGKELSEEDISPYLNFLWCYRTVMKNRKAFGVPVEQKGIKWWELREVYKSRLSTPLSITFAEVATHNHFVLDRGGKVFNQTAPVIKLPPGANEEEHLALLGLFNSSAACFWLRQVCFPKGGFAAGKWEERYAFNATNLQEFPIPPEKPLSLATQLDTLAQQRQSHLSAQLVFPLTRKELDAHRVAAQSIWHHMIALQEELDWQCYRLYGILDEDLTFPGELPKIRFGERAFEIVMARQMVEGSLETTWFARHGSQPCAEIPSHWPADYRALVERRIQTIETNHNIGLVEQPEYKRRWNLESWEYQETRALRGWLLDRLEGLPVWQTDTPTLTTCARLADGLHLDRDFLQVAELYRGRADFDLTALVTELVLSEAVPFLPVLRYTESGLRKRAAWEATWELQRREDAGETIDTIPVPPKYTSSDFVGSVYWGLRGKLDVPKERFILYSHCGKGFDPTPVIAWAGWNHLQQAQALAGYFLAMKDNEGWTTERLTPLLTGLQELLPWLRQWHNELDPNYGIGMGDYFAGFMDEALRGLGVTEPSVREWRPPQTIRRRGRR